LFQINDTGSVLRVAWPRRQGNAWLVLDRNGDGIINSGAELFGNATRMSDGQIASDGYHAPTEFDLNRDKLIDSRDPVFSDLRLWLDTDRNGVSETIELRTLASIGIAALSINPKESRRVDRHGNRFALRAPVYWSSGARAFSYDVYPVTLNEDGTALFCAAPEQPLK
jgi:trimeric autotransporter adhesin